MERSWEVKNNRKTGRKTDNSLVEVTSVHHCVCLYFTLIFEWLRDDVYFLQERNYHQCYKAVTPCSLNLWSSNERWHMYDYADNKQISVLSCSTEGDVVLLSTIYVFFVMSLNIVVGCLPWKQNMFVKELMNNIVPTCVNLRNIPIRRLQTFIRVG